jgi:hypothetical protein
MEPIEAALAFLGPYEPGTKYHYAAVAKRFDCSRPTLSKRHRGVQGPRKDQYAKLQLLQPEQEEFLVKYINILTQRALPPSKEMIRNFAREISGKEVGKHWAERFITRHGNDLLTQWSSGMDKERHKADSAVKYSLYFDLLKRKIEEYGIVPWLIYNMDEKGFLIGVLSKQKRVFGKRLYEEGGLRQFIQDGNREWITVIACICADGSVLDPALIYQSVGENIQDTWLEDYNPQVHKAHISSSPSGWTSDRLGFQ